MDRYRRALAKQDARNDAANAETFARMRANREALGGIEQIPQRSPGKQGSEREYDYDRLRILYAEIGTYDGAAYVAGCSASTVRRAVVGR